MEKKIMGIIRTICISKKKGTAKTPAKGSVRLIEGFGIEGDAHAGRWHRQISLLSYESIQILKLVEPRSETEASGKIS